MRAAPVSDPDVQFGPLPPESPKHTPSVRELENDRIVEQLQQRPGEWALVREFAHSHSTTTWRQRGCEATSRTVRRNGLRGYDIYARWPTGDAS